MLFGVSCGGDSPEHDTSVESSQGTTQGTAVTVEEARALIQGRPDIPEPPGTALSAPPDIPEQIRKLSEFRDAGVLDEDDFEAKKKDLFNRMWAKQLDQLGGL
jgi:hypothetical protein